MTKEKSDLTRAWPETTFDRRVYDCLQVLYLHGLITHGERCKAVRRIHKLLAKMEKEAERSSK